MRLLKRGTTVKPDGFGLPPLPIPVTCPSCGSSDPRYFYGSCGDSLLKGAPTDTYHAGARTWM